jgi:hypothetical protein
MTEMSNKVQACVGPLLAAIIVAGQSAST